MSTTRSAGSVTLGLPGSVHACLFDLDGVLTDTASVHARAWKEMFDGFLHDRATSSGSATSGSTTSGSATSGSATSGRPSSGSPEEEDDPLRPFDIATDYPRYVDGRRRADGTRSFLLSRGIDLPEGEPDDPAERETVNGLGTRKNDLVQAQIARYGVTVYEGSVRYLKAAREAGMRVAVVSSSANTKQILEATGLEQYVEARVDAQAAMAAGLAGKPAPDTFLAGARLLDVPASQAVVFEDALAGVQAGRDGSFAVVVGVDRVGGGHGNALREHGADVVVTDLEQLLDRTPVTPEH